MGYSLEKATPVLENENCILSLCFLSYSFCIKIFLWKGGMHKKARAGCRVTSSNNLCFDTGPLTELDVSASARLADQLALRTHLSHPAVVGLQTYLDSCWHLGTELRFFCLQTTKLSPYFLKIFTKSSCLREKERGRRKEIMLFQRKH